MEIVQKRAFIFSAFVAALGVAFLLAGGKVAAPKSEIWLASLAPVRVAGAVYEPDHDDPTLTYMSYKMDQNSYLTLQPYGIISRLYRVGDTEFDSVVIASQRKASFHDPRVCFRGQGWVFDDQQVIEIPTKSRGTVRATFLHMDGKSGSNLAVFLYKGPDGFVASTLDLKTSLFKHELLTGSSSEGVFYRFIMLSGGKSKRDLVSFVADFLDAANHSSHGYL